MSLRRIGSCLAILALIQLASGLALAADMEAIRATLEGQFADLDANDDGTLDEDELDKLPPGQLEALHNNGLPAVYPLPREVFVAAGMTLANAMMPEDMSEADSGRRESPVKGTDLKPESKSNPKLVMIRNSAKKSHYVPALPSEFNARDKNGDGQIALYEWDRKKYSEFAKLDKNGDGFLTPAELLPKGALKTLYTRATEPAKAGEQRSGERGRDGGDRNGGDRNGGDRGEDPSERDARNIFGRLDENKDGMIDETEWGKSRMTKGSLEQAGVTVSLPFNVEALTGYMRRAREASGR